MTGETGEVNATHAAKVSLEGVDLSSLASEADAALTGLLNGLAFLQKFPIVGSNATLTEIITALTFVKGLLDKL
jgi:hypothetical protein